ncbi:MAG: fumarate hydratase C-terminal domain-containing protein [Nitrospirae bacterium]|jgi:tartrate/fumarate subfamily iron-sulfur-dependent hydro-lyase beta chain|nr:fumarate hydratase C-terminal domain-containing protein [Nitrospirota bacterium]
MKAKTINLPLTKDDVLKLNVGDMVLINGHLITGRDKLHKFFVNEKPSKKQIPFNLEGTILYHCGPIIKKRPKGFETIAGGPTTSMRVEMYEQLIISEYGFRGIMGKGGMGRQTLNALKENGCVYLHTIGGAAVYLADRVKRVVDVWKLEEFGMAEAMWMFDVEDFPAIVTMDAHGRSLHEEIEKSSYTVLKRLIG